jgi:hypothetical protein
MNNPGMIRTDDRLIIFTGISISIFRQADNIHPVASKWKVQPDFDCWVFALPLKEVSLKSPENPKTRRCRFS